MRPNIAIDGPAGAGKSTVARRVAEKLGFLYIDTGAMYRAVAYCALKAGIDLEAEEKVVELARDIDISLSYVSGKGLMTVCNGKDISDKIRTQEVSQNVSRVASIPGVRLELVKLQRKMAAGGGVIMDGRDIGSYVLPDAELKLFVTASIEKRALRRLNELEARGYDVDFEAIKNEIIQRDTLDSSRAFAPLKKVPEAITVDTTDMTIDEAVQCILDIFRERFGENV